MIRKENLLATKVVMIWKGNIKAQLNLTILFDITEQRLFYLAEHPRSKGHKAFLIIHSIEIFNLKL